MKLGLGRWDRYWLPVGSYPTKAYTSYRGFELNAELKYGLRHIQCSSGETLRAGPWDRLVCRQILQCSNNILQLIFLTISCIVCRFHVSMVQIVTSSRAITSSTSFIKKMETYYIIHYSSVSLLCNFSIYISRGDGMPALASLGFGHYWTCRNF